MKKLLFISVLALGALGMFSCDCTCYQQPGGGSTVCKNAYEDVYGVGSWSQGGAATYRNAGWSCVN